MSEGRPVRRALLAVYDKVGVVELATALDGLGVALVSSGGTAATLREAGLPVTPVEDVTGSPEMLGGRVKTLHPAIHGGILADRRRPEHEAELAEHAIEPFELVVVNLYPFRETVASGAGPDDVIEQLRVFEREGVEHMGIVFLGETMDELLADMELFAERVGPAFARGREA